ncbi:hypothetical protein ACK35P_10675 [Aeromonas veronii]
MSLQKRVDRSVQVLEAKHAINVQWTDVFIENGVEISRSTRARGYGKNQRAEFLADCPDAEVYADLAGLVTPPRPESPELS